MNEATNGFSRVVEYKGCAIDPVSTAGSWVPRWTREGKRYDRLPAFATRTKAIEQTKRIIDAETWQRYCKYNVARDMEHANTRKEFNEWCADRDRRTGNKAEADAPVVRNKKVEWGVLVSLISL